MNKKQIAQSIIFLLVGVVLFRFVYKDFNMSEIKDALKHLDFFWIIVAVIIGLISHIVRALRWQMLLKPMNYETNTFLLFISILILYFTNLIIPRGGELARCGVVSRYEKIPFARVFGTVITERLSDFLSFLLVLITVVIWQFPILMQLFEIPEFQFSDFQVGSLALKLSATLIVLFLVLYFFVRTALFEKVKERLIKIKTELTEGILSIFRMQKSYLYIIYTFSIYALWVLMFYFIFFSFEPTSHLTFSVALFSYSVASLAFILPIQAGMGAWHFMVIQCLFLFGISQSEGMIYALVAHTFISLIYLFFGTIAFAFLPLLKKKMDNKSEIET